MGLQSQLSAVISAIGSDIKYLTERDLEASKVKGNLLVNSFSATTISGVTFYGDGSNLTGIKSIAGSNNIISSASTSSGIFGGTDNVINSNVSRSVIIGGSNIVATQSDTVYVPNLNIQIIGTDTPLYNLGVDSDGNVVIGTSNSSSGSSSSLESRHDYQSPYSYCGVAPLGSLESQSVWTIKRIEVNIDGTTTKKTATNVIWNNRYSLTYI